MYAGGPAGKLWLEANPSLGRFADLTQIIYALVCQGLCPVCLDFFLSIQINTMKPLRYSQRDKDLGWVLPTDIAEEGFSPEARGEDGCTRLPQAESFPPPFSTCRPSCMPAGPAAPATGQGLPAFMAGSPKTTRIPALGI